MTRMAGDNQVAAALTQVGAVLISPASTTDELAQALINQAEIIQDKLIKEGAIPSSGRDLRDYRIEPGLWRSEILPLGMGIDEAIQAGIW
jgi:hypothetical protein